MANKNIITYNCKVIFINYTHCFLKLGCHLGYSKLLSRDTLIPYFTLGFRHNVVILNFFRLLDYFNGLKYILRLSFKNIIIIDDSLSLNNFFSNMSVLPNIYYFFGKWLGNKVHTSFTLNSFINSGTKFFIWHHKISFVIFLSYTFNTYAINTFFKAGVPSLGLVDSRDKFSCISYPIFTGCLNTSQKIFWCLLFFNLLKVYNLSIT